MKEHHQPQGQEAGTEEKEMWDIGSCLRATKMCAVVFGSGMGLRVVYSNCQCDFQDL
uniref:Uncharacterized protein n=1 Tax=Accipiter nisus TaxID=211598 RepID=A0A8B9MEZ7_9AVES